MKNKQVKKINSEEENALKVIEELFGKELVEDGAKVIYEDIYRINPETLERV